MIDERDPFRLTEGMEPEFGMMLSYLQELSSKKRPNYKMLRSQFEVMKERRNLKCNLEWISKCNEGQSFKNDINKNFSHGADSLEMSNRSLSVPKSYSMKSNFNKIIVVGELDDHLIES